MEVKRNNFEPNEEDKKRILNSITNKYQKKHQEVIKQPNVMLAGCSGSGKSSIINAIFGDPSLAKTGTGKAVTSEMVKIGGIISDKDVIQTKRPIIIHDVQGLETGEGQTEKYIQSNLDYISKQNIHVVWYVVGVGVSRFLEGDLYLIHNLYSKFPVIIVLNKVDQMEKEKTMEFENKIKEMIMNYEKEKNVKSNIKAIVKTSANIYDKDRRTVYMYKKCIKCNSERTLMDTYECKGICRNKECGHIENIKIENGLEDLVHQTLKVLPEVVQNTFICEQQVALKIKDLIARDTIKKSVDKARNDYTSIFSEESITLIIDLSEIFGMSNSGKSFAHSIYEWYSKEIIGDSLFSKFIFQTCDYFQKLFQKLTNTQMIIACEGMFWYYIFRKNYVKNLTSIQEIDQENYKIYEKYWDILSKNTLDETLDFYFEELRSSF